MFLDRGNYLYFSWVSSWLQSLPRVYKTLLLEVSVVLLLLFPSSFLWRFETVSNCAARASLELPMYPRVAFQSSSRVLIDGL